MPRSGFARVFVCALAFVSMKTLFNSFSAGPCVPALCELHTASRPPALASVRLVYPPIARGAPVARGSPCALRPAPRPLWQRPSGPSPRRPRHRPGAVPFHRFFAIASAQGFSPEKPSALRSFCVYALVPHFWPSATSRPSRTPPSGTRERRHTPCRPARCLTGRGGRCRTNPRARRRPSCRTASLSTVQWIGPSRSCVSSAAPLAPRSQSALEMRPPYKFQYITKQN